METAAVGNSRRGRGTPRPRAKQQKVKSRMARRRLSQAQHRATLSGLFQSLRRAVYSKSDCTASKWQVLNKAKYYIKALEQTLDTLLKVKDSFKLADMHASTLQEVKEEYARIYSSNHGLISKWAQQKGGPWRLRRKSEKDAEEDEEEKEGDQKKEEDDDDRKDEEEGEREEEEEEEKEVELISSPDALSPDLLEFERYFTFYRFTMDFLMDNNIVSSEEGILPIISAAISHLWQNLSEEKKTSLLQDWVQAHQGLPSPPGLCQELPNLPSIEGSGLDSQGTNFSLLSTPEEILFEDAFHVTSALDRSEVPRPSSSSCNSEEEFHLYVHILHILKSLFCASTNLEQEPVVPVDEDMMMLRCMETFDDEDL